MGYGEESLTLRNYSGHETINSAVRSRVLMIRITSAWCNRGRRMESASRIIVVWIEESSGRQWQGRVLISVSSVIWPGVWTIILGVINPSILGPELGVFLDALHLLEQTQRIDVIIISCDCNFLAVLIADYAIDTFHIEKLFSHFLFALGATHWHFQVNVLHTRRNCQIDTSVIRNSLVRRSINYSNLAGPSFQFST